MQETASNLLGKYFKKQQVQKQNAPKNEHPLIMKFATDPYMGNRVESCIDTKIDFSMSYVELPKELFIKVLQTIEQVESLEKTIEEYKSTVNKKDRKIDEIFLRYEQLKTEFSNYQKEQELEKQIFDKKVRELDDSIEDKNKQIALHKNVINEKNNQERTLKDEINELQTNLKFQENKYEILGSKYSDLHFEYNKLKKIIDLANSQQIRQMDQFERINIKEIEAYFFNKSIDLNYIFSEGLGKKICLYLDYKDLLNLRMVNKTINFIFVNDSSYYFLLAQKIRSKFLVIRNDLLKKLNCHRELASKIPDLFVKHSFSKYVWSKETVGEYMIGAIVQGEKFFNMLLDSEDSSKEQAKGKSDNQFGKSFFQKLVKKIDDVKVSNKAPTSQNISYPSQKIPIMTQSSQKISYIDLMNQETQQNEYRVNPSPIFQGQIQTISIDSDIPEKLFDLPEIKRELFLSNYENNPFCIFIPGDAYLNPKEDKKNMLQKASAYIEDMIKALIKRKQIIQDNSELLVNLLQVFGRVFVCSKILLQECKELEALKDYVIAKFEEIKNKVTTIENSIEDYKEAIITEKNLKDIFSKKTMNLEAQLHNQNVQILKDSENILLLKNQINSSKEEVERFIKEKHDFENKVKILAKEVKNLRAKNKELEKTNEHIMTGYHDIKLTFDNLDFEV